MQEGQSVAFGVRREEACGGGGSGGGGGGCAVVRGAEGGSLGREGWGFEERSPGGKIAFTGAWGEVVVVVKFGEVGRGDCGW